MNLCILPFSSLVLINAPKLISALNTKHNPNQSGPILCSA